MTTKEQERQALAKIKKILEGLEENSWVRSAFAGCVEDAHENIENDWCLSYKDRYELSQKHLNEANQERQELREKVERLEAVNISREAVADALQIARERAAGVRNNMEVAANEMFEHCEKPDSREFREAAAHCAHSKAKLAKVVKLVADLETAFNRF